MRLCKGTNEMEVQRLKKFSQWVLNIGNSKVPKPTDGMFEYNEDDIQIPEEYCNFQNKHYIDNMISTVYPNMIDNLNIPDYWSERAILTPVNQTVSHLNSQIVDQIPGEYFSYSSMDSAEDFGGSEADLNSIFPTEYLNSLNMSGLPSHELKLKVGVVVMLTQNLNQTLRLCNDTRMIVTKCLKNRVQCEVICGTYVGTRHFIPRMELIPSDTRLPFKLVRKQLPIQVYYAMTINKSQG
ncbi:uncharacterized protein LOC141718661 [Apium graveolens]|uniref:uncharacterized protein LOC141718661 n=1 Tax=Apium graveolens TaxID=4045 RepID=UPI003D79278A